MADRLLTSAEKLVAILTGVEGSLLLGMRLLLWRVEPARGAAPGPQPDLRSCDQGPEVPNPFR